MFISPKILAYLSLFMGIIVLSTTICMIIFPAFFQRRDSSVSFNTKRNAFLTNLAMRINKTISFPSVGYLYFFLSLFFLYFNYYKLLAISITGIVSASIWFWTVKRITQRKRPPRAKIKFSDYSFPSGHTTAGFVILLTLAFIVNQLFGITTYGWISYAIAIGGGAIVGRSRRYLHVHRVSDIIIGALLGSGCFLFAYLFFFYFGDAVYQTIIQVFFTLS